jgi:hypothetical protein
LAKVEARAKVQQRSPVENRADVARGGCQGAAAGGGGPGVVSRPTTTPGPSFPARSARPRAGASGERVRARRRQAFKLANSRPRRHPTRGSDSRIRRLARPCATIYIAAGRKRLRGVSGTAKGRRPRPGGEDVDDFHTGAAYARTRRRSPHPRLCQNSRTRARHAKFAQRR